MAERFCKTDLGRQEIRERAHALSRTARNLLLILDGSRPADEWLALVQGAAPADLQALRDAGLIAPQVAASTPPVAPLPERKATAPAAPPPPTEGSMSYSALYDTLNTQVKTQLGLIKGYRFSLDIERSANLAELREVAVQVLEEVQRVKGEAAAQALRTQLGLVH